MGITTTRRIFIFIWQ